MKAYVLGAGASIGAGYPSGERLFDEIDSAVRSVGPVFHGFDFKKWPELCGWLEKNENRLISEAHKMRLLEPLLTALDLAELLRYQALVRVWLGHQSYDTDPIIREYQEQRTILLWFMEWYFRKKHAEDLEGNRAQGWDTLRSFGRKLCPGDVVITFNYDATVERVLWEQRKWSPKDGYGWNLAFQKESWDSTPTDLPTSDIRIMHLHGAVGWYRRRKRALGQPHPFPEEGSLSLDPMFLSDLGVHCVDAAMPDRSTQEPSVLLHPSFIKDYGQENAAGFQIFDEVWRGSAKALRCADEVVIIGYSLPEADGAALTLLQTNCERSKVRVVNLDSNAAQRISRLLAANPAQGPRSFEDWLTGVPDCSG